MRNIWLGLLVAVSFFALPAQAADEQLYQQCLTRQLATAEDTTTIGELRQYCQTKTLALAEQSAEQDEPLAESEEKVQQSALSRRLLLEQEEASNPFVLIPHKPNYIIFSNNMSSPNEAPFELADPDDNTHFQPWETKFQISLKTRVMQGLFDGRADWFVAYTNRSFWQQFNKDGSAPFRDSNHEPETWLSFKNDYELFGVRNSIIRTGISHQSNGQSGVLSRSWNRVYADFILEYNDWYFSVKPWWRIPESSDNDDNPDIEEYMGNFEFGALYQAGKHNFDVVLRNNLNFDDNYGAIQLGWSFPISDRVRGYVQWFNGYGESLIDYDAHSNSIGFGLQLSDWL